MPAITLPSTFSNSFWSQNYRQGIETLYKKLDQGVEENDEIIAFIRARAAAENNIADALIASQDTGRRGKGFNGDEGASLLMAFRGLQGEAGAQGSTHRTIAKELTDLVAGPFDEWASGHKERIYGSRNSIIEGWLKSYELAQGDVDKMKHQYLAKVRRADEAEDEAKHIFALNKDADNYTTSPRLPPRDQRNPQRTASVTDRIAQRFKEIQQRATSGSHPDQEKKGDESSSVVFDEKAVTSEPDAHEAEKESPPLPTVNKGKEKAVDDPQTLLSPPPMTLDLPPKQDSGLSSPVPPHPPPPMLLAGLALPPAAVSNLLQRAAADMDLRPIKFPIIGEYKDCFSGEDFVVWLVDHVHGLGGSLDRAEDAAKDLCDREGLLRRIGEFGNAFENSEEAFYQFRPKAFNLEAEYSKHGQSQSDSLSSPIGHSLSPIADNLMKRSNTIVSRVSKAIGDRNGEPIHVRARAEANAADAAYRSAVRKLDRQRLGLEERVEETLKLLQKWELDRLRAVKTVLLQYQGTLANLPSGLQSSFDRSSTLVASYQPEADLRALIERYRTGPFKPTAHVYESLTHEEADVYFGIDLRRWAEGGWSSLRSDEPPKDNIPEVLAAMLSAMDRAYPKLPSDDEKRKAWIYEVPLSSTHHLRENLNAVAPGQPFPEELISKYDAPVIASTIKLWALELDPPLCTWEGWDDFKRIYPSMGSGTAETDHQQRIQDLQTAFLRLPRIHLLVLDAFLKHLKNLIITTKAEEEDEVYVTKIALSLGRSILRPKVEDGITIQNRHPMLLFMDLINHYDDILPPTLARKKRESDRKIPLRKRTAPIDMRVSRSRLSVANVDTREILEEQMMRRNPSMRPHSRSPSAAGSPEGLNHVNNLASGATEPSASNATADGKMSQESKFETSSTRAPATAPVPPNPTGAGYDAPPMPTFKEPPPEKDDDIAPPPMPKFVEPPPEVDDTPTVGSGRASPLATERPNTPNAAPVSVAVAPPTPDRPNSPTSPTARNAADRSSAAADIVIGAGAGEGAKLSRSGSNENARLRGPRGARLAGVRPPSSGNASSSTTAGAGGLQRNRLSYAGRSASPTAAKRGMHKMNAGSFSHTRQKVTSDGEE